jgi:hypothetical protein
MDMAKLDKILLEREATHGNIVQDGGRLAEMWQLLLAQWGAGKEFKGTDPQKGTVPISTLPGWMYLLLQASMKIARIASNPAWEDSWDDAVNYLRLGHAAYLGLKKVPLIDSVPVEWAKLLEGIGLELETDEKKSCGWCDRSVVQHGQGLVLRGKPVRSNIYACCGEHLREQLKLDS